MRNGEHVTAVAGFQAIFAQALPQLFYVGSTGDDETGLHGVRIRVRLTRQVDRCNRTRHHPVVAEDNVAMPVLPQRRRGHLVGNEACERAARGAIVGFLSHLLYLVPHPLLARNAVSLAGQAHRQAGVEAARPVVWHDSKLKAEVALAR